MEYTGIINWGPVEALIRIFDIEKGDDGRINKAKIMITLNGHSKLLEYNPVS